MVASPLCISHKAIMLGNKKPRKERGLVHPNNPYAKRYMVFDPKKRNSENPKFRKKSTNKTSVVSHYLQTGFKKNLVRLTSKTVWKSTSTPNTSGNGDIQVKTMIGDLASMGFYDGWKSRLGVHHACRSNWDAFWWTDYLLHRAIEGRTDLQNFLEFDSKNPHPTQDVGFWTKVDELVQLMLMEIKKYEVEGLTFSRTDNPTAAAIGCHLVRYQKLYCKATGTFSKIDLEEADKVDWSKLRNVGQKSLFEFMK